MNEILKVTFTMSSFGLKCINSNYFQLTCLLEGITDDEVSFVWLWAWQINANQPLTAAFIYVSLDLSELTSYLLYLKWFFFLKITPYHLAAYCEAAIYRWRKCDGMVNSLRPSDAIWRQWFWTTLAQVMACCLTAPSHYLNQCWLIIRGVLWHTSESSFAGIAQGIDSGYEFEKDILKNIFKSPRGQWVKKLHRAHSASLAHCVVTPCHDLSHLLLDKMAAISQMSYINAFPWMKIF